MSKKMKFLGVAMALMFALLLAACGGNDNNEAANNNGNSNNDDNAASGDNIELGETELTVPYVAWAGALVRTPMLTMVLEEAGYDVNATQVDAGPMWSSVADGSADFMTASWLPATHQSYLDKYEDDVEVIGEFIEKAPLALTVPEYMDDVNSIEDLKDNEELGESVDWTIVGIDPGAGIMQNTEEALDHYELENWDLQESSEGAMLSELQSKIDDEEPIIVPLWKPHWAFAELDLKMLEDPDEVYGGDGDRIEAVANPDFEDNSPGAYEIVQRFTEDYDQDIENELLVAVNEGASEEEAAQDFLDEHQDMLDEWIEGIGN